MSGGIFFCVLENRIKQIRFRQIKGDLPTAKGSGDLERKLYESAVQDGDAKDKLFTKAPL